MTENKRIILNILASYGRNLFVMLCGLFVGRWVLMALGEIDYGLYGVIGGLMAFIGFFNNVLAGAVGRYYAIAIGQARVAEDQSAAIEECRCWFNTALSVHTIIPLVLILIGYPIGVWAIHHWLVIPPDRVEACVWVFRCTCFSCLIGMMNIPFTAMYTAKQYIAELTIYSFVTTSLNAVALYYMASHPGAWLVKYALWTCLITVAPQIIIMLRALKIFPECRLRWHYWYDSARLKQVGAYAGWQILGSFCGLLRTQGISILVNKMFGPKVNAAQAIANSVNAHSSSLAGAMLGAFMPAITSACGEGDLPKMRKMAFRACKFGLLLALLFMLPLALELPEIVRLWLKDPPQYAVGLCWCMLLLYLAEVCTHGHMVVVNANGKIRNYQIVLSAISIFTIPAAWLCIRLGFGVYFSIGGVLVIGIALNSIGRLFFARALTQMSIRYWTFHIMLPIGMLCLVCGAIGFLPHLFMATSVWRILVTTLFTEVVFLPLVWYFVLDVSERTFVCEKMLSRIPIVKKFAHRYLNR